MLTLDWLVRRHNLHARLAWYQDLKYSMHFWVASLLNVVYTICTVYMFIFNNCNISKCPALFHLIRDRLMLFGNIYSNTFTHIFDMSNMMNPT